MLPVLPRPGLDAAAQARLDQAVLLAAAPASARQAVPDAVLAEFMAEGAPRAVVAPDGEAWSLGPAALAPAPPPPPAPTLRGALGRAEDAMRVRMAAGEPGWGPAADRLDRARVLADRLDQSEAVPPAYAVRLPPVTAPAAPPPSTAAADAALARLQLRAAEAASGDDLPAALATLRGTLLGAPAPLLALLAELDLPSPPGAAPAPVAPPAVPGRRVPSLPPAPAAPLAVATAGPATTGWGSRPRPALVPPPEEAGLPQAPPPYGPGTAGTLAGIAAAAGLMRRQGLGSPAEPGSWERLAATIRATGVSAAPAPDPAELGRLIHWGGLARQATLLRDRLGLDPCDPDDGPALAEALRQRASWLAERPAWPARPEAMAALTQWLPLVDCAEALGLPLRGAGALAALGAALRSVAAMPLPGVTDPVGLAQHLAATDARASLGAALGMDPAAPEAPVRMARLAEGLARLPAPPAVETAGALDRSALGRLRGLDRRQAGALGLDGLSAVEVPLLSRGLPVLALRDAEARLTALPDAPVADPRPPRLRSP